MGKHLNADQIQFFEENGYLVLQDIVKPDTIRAVIEEYTRRLEELAQRFYAAGRISSIYTDLPFGDRYTRILFEYPDLLSYLEISLPLLNEGMPEDLEMHTGPAVFDLLTDAGVLDVVESLLGPEITSNPVQHLRIKPPASRVPSQLRENSYVARTTWHQDQGALLEEANETQMITVWAAITDATEENGCMVCIPRSHKKGGGELTVHCPGEGIVSENFIPTTLLEMDAAVTMPVRSGGVVLLNQFTEHAALDNRSDAIRWSFDLRYNVTGQPTGRPAFPAFIARSRAEPERALRDPAVWQAMWETAYRRILNGETGPIFNAARWARYAGSPICA